MATEDDLIGDRLSLPLCRPTLLWGIPMREMLAILGFWAVGLVLFGAAITGTGVAIVLYFVIRAITAKDFNAIPAFFCYGRTKFLEQRAVAWTGVTLDPLYGQRPPR
jgi:type IV secretory pathway VirB3-like protein